MIEVYYGKNTVQGPGVLSCRFCETDLAHWTHELSAFTRTSASIEKKQLGVDQTSADASPKHWV